MAGSLSDAASAIGPIGLLVNNASVFEPDELEDFTWQHWDRHFAVHLKAPVELSRRFAEPLPQGEDGIIVNMIDQRVLKLTPRTFSPIHCRRRRCGRRRRRWRRRWRRASASTRIGPGPPCGLPPVEGGFRRADRRAAAAAGTKLSEFGAHDPLSVGTPSITGQMIALDGGQHLALADAGRDGNS